MHNTKSPGAHTTSVARDEAVRQLVKRHKLKARHACPYRPLHLGSLVILIALLFGSFYALQWYMNDRFEKQLAAIGSDGFVPSRQTAGSGRIESSRGFAVAYDADLFQVQASVSLPGGKTETHSGSNTTNKRDYTSAQFSLREKNLGDSSNFDRSSMMIRSYDEQTEALGDDSNKNISILSALTKKYQDSSSPETTVSQTMQETTEISGRQFQKTTYTIAPTLKPSPHLELQPVKAMLYVTVLNGRPFIIKLSTLSDGISPQAAYEAIISSLEFDTATVASTVAPSLVETAGAALPKAQQKAEALAAGINGHKGTTTAGVSDNTQLVAKYSPAVVKIYHILCGTFVIDGVAVGGETCDGGTGSGFIVSNDGYVATNGHVVAASARDVLANNPQLFQNVLRGLGVSEKDLNVLFTNDVAYSSFLQKIYSLPNSAIYMANQKELYLVALGETKPDMDSVLKTHTFKDTVSIKNARLVASEYEASNLVSGTGFTKSDVALLKIEGKGFPVVRLGSLSDINQGEALTVIGFPGNAEYNGITDDSKLVPTATNGVVSALRGTNGDGRRIVQSDAKIGHGNSGGPALDQSGRVFGLATYSLPGRQPGDADYSYMRDIHDLVNLSQVQKVSFDTNSQIQTLWEKGLADYFNARYSPAIRNFEAVQALYPPHRLANLYITNSKDKIAQGLEAKSTLVPIISIATLVFASIGLIVTVIFIVKHHGRHQIFKLLHHSAA